MEECKIMNENGLLENKTVNVLISAEHSNNMSGIPENPLRVLIGGKGSFIGTSVRNFLNSYPTKYSVTELDMLTDEWKTFDFSEYDVIYHVAGIAHIKETVENAHLYFDVNRDLAFDVAKRAKEAGVKHFVYMSSMSVYGLDVSKTPLTLTSPTNPVTNYGKSKLEAEKKLETLASDNFIISYLRPPMVYGEGAPGNLEKLFKLVRKVHFFPTVKNQRSSISVGNLCKGVEHVINNQDYGIVILQDSEYRCTKDIIRTEMKKEGVKVCFTPVFNWVIHLLVGHVGIVSKAFGDLVYGK